MSSALATRGGETVKKESSLKEELTRARRTFVLAEKLAKKGQFDAEGVEQERLNYQRVLRARTQEIAAERGADAAAQFEISETSIFGRINREKNANKIKALAAAAVIAAAGVAIMAGPATAAYAASAYVLSRLPAFAAGFIASYGLQKLFLESTTKWFIQKFFAGKVAKYYGLAAEDLSTENYNAARAVAQKHLASGKSYASFKNTREGKIVEANAWLQKYVTRTRAGTSLAIGFGSTYVDGGSLGQGLIKSATGDIHGLDGAYVPTGGYEAMHTVRASVGDSVEQFLTFLFWTKSASAHEMDTTDIHGHTPKHLKVLGTDPFDGKRPTEITAQEATEAGKRLATKGNWSAEQLAAFIKKALLGDSPTVVVHYDEILKQNYIEGAKGMRTYIAMDSMVTGSGIEGPVTIPDNTPVKMVVYDYTDAQGVLRHKVVYMPLICENFADGGDYVQPEVIPVPEAPHKLFDIWGGHFMDLMKLPDGRCVVGWHYILGFTIDHLKPGQTVEQAIAEAAEKLKAALPKGYNGQKLFVRVDLDGDGVPDQAIKCIHIEDIGTDHLHLHDVELSEDGTPRLVRDISKVKTFNISEQPLDKQDAYFEGTNPDDNHVVRVDKVDTDKFGGPTAPKSTGLPLDKWDIENGALVLEKITPFEFAQEQSRLFQEWVMGEEQIISTEPNFKQLKLQLAGIQQLEAAPYAEIKDASVSELMKRFNLTEAQAQRVIEYIKGAAKREYDAPETPGETTLDYLTKVFKNIADRHQVQ